MTSPNDKPVGDGLAEVMGLLGKATPRNWYVGETLRAEALAVVGDGDSVVCEFPDRIGGAEDDAAAIAAAVNYLRSHGEAIRELVEADREYDEAIATHGISSRWAIEATERRRAALAKFTEPRP